MKLVIAEGIDPDAQVFKNIDPANSTDFEKEILETDAVFYGTHFLLKDASDKIKMYGICISEGEMNLTDTGKFLIYDNIETDSYLEGNRYEFLELLKKNC